MNVVERNQLYLKGILQGEGLSPLQSLFWRSEKHEIDFVRRGRPWIEVKAGHASPFEFDWFTRSFPREKLLVVSSDRFDGSAVRGVTLEDFLLDESS